MTDERMKEVYALSRVSFFSALTTGELQELAEEFVWEEYPRDMDIIRQGETKPRFYVLVEGRAEALMSRTGRASWQVNYFGPGDAFGEISLFTGKPAPTTVRSLDHCLVLALDSEHFARMMVRWPKLYPEFIQKLSYSLNRVNQIVWETKHKEFLRMAHQLSQNEEKYYGLWGSVRTTQEVEGKITELAQSPDPVFLIGERGTGRQMLAWFIHKKKCGETAPFITADAQRFEREWGAQSFTCVELDPFESQENIPFIPESTIFDVAEGGTLFIRDIQRISPHVQKKLARVLQARKLKCFVLASVDSLQSLDQLIIPELKEQFKLHYTLQSMRHRKRDIPILAQGILEKMARQYHRDPPHLNAEATKLLLSHSYQQGNVTELIRVVERAFFLAEGTDIGLEHIFFGPTGEKADHSINLLSNRFIAKLLKNGKLVQNLQRLSAVIYVVILFILLFLPSTRIAGITFSLVWGLWWPALTLISPFLGRLWCTICPFSFFMERFQHKFHLNRPVPDFFKKYNYFTMTLFFLLIFWLEVILHLRSHPIYTAILLLSIQTGALLLGGLYQRHAWCNYFCPLGSFVGMASSGAIFEVRSDASFCLNKCTTVDCYRGNGTLPGCPMAQHLPYMDNNLACKLCFNCIRNCPNEAVKLNLRAPGREIWHLVRVNQGFILFIGVSLAILFPLNYFGHLSEFPHWQLWFSLSYWGSAVLGGGVAWMLVHPFKTKAASWRVKSAFALIPLMLSGYIIFELNFVPGIHTLVLGWGQTHGLESSNFSFFPADQVGQLLAASVGLVLSAFAFGMIWLQHHKNSSG